MIKRFLAFTFVLVFLLGITACSSEDKKPVSNNETADISSTLTYTNPEYGYSLELPKEWNDKLIVEEEKDVTRFIYKSKQHPEYKAQVFAIHVFTVEQWEKVKDEPGYGQPIIQNSNYVYVYTVGLDNSYEGSEAEEYSKLVQGVQLLMKNFKVQ